MKIKSIQQKTVSLNSEVRNAVIDFSTMTTSIVAVVTDVVKNGKPVVGFGFNSNGRYAQEGILKERIIPRLLSADRDALLNNAGDNLDPFKCWDVMMKNEKPGGHGDRSVAVGTVDMAIWDIVAKIENKPLYKLLSERYRDGKAKPEVYTYAAGGYYYPGKALTGLLDEFKRYLDMGFESCKMKIGGASLNEDLARIEAALKIVDKGSALAVDANGRFDLRTAVKYAEAIEPFGLKWYEEPVDPLDFQSLAALSESLKMPLATGENIFSLPDSRNLILYGNLNPNRDYLQMDPVLGYGLTEYIRILNMLKDKGWSSKRCIPHGGHQFGLHIAAGLELYGNESYPEVFLPFGKFSDNMKLENGIIKLNSAPGIGYETVEEIYKIFNQLL
ncbi:MAG: enolase C-terminal domain-like protein [Melioribacteraceae bacterium]|nr:enolase C-terminal domain-like protein [Melioribacteraceae bacterium]